MEFYKSTEYATRRIIVDSHAVYSTFGTSDAVYDWEHIAGAPLKTKQRKMKIYPRLRTDGHYIIVVRNDVYEAIGVNTRITTPPESFEDVSYYWTLIARKES